MRAIGIWQQRRMLFVLFFFVGIGLFAPLSWKQTFSACLVRFLPSDRAKPVDGASAHLELLDNWDQQTQRQMQMASFWMKVAKRRMESSNPAYDVLQMQTLLGQAVLSEVVFMPPGRQSSVIWIRSSLPVSRGSAVIFGDVLVGYVDLAFPQVSRVRLIHDPACQISVRAMRAQNPFQPLLSDVENWISYCEMVGSKSQPISQTIVPSLQQLAKKLAEGGISWRSCAKGLLMGSNSSWRSREPFLSGTGFNYAWPDSAGSEDKFDTLDEKNALIAVGDELVTSGLDGRFPAGLRVARVIKTHAVDPAGTLYDLKATPIINLGQLPRWVWVLPPLMELPGSLLPPTSTQTK